MIPRPRPGDYSDYFDGYVARVPDGDVLQGLRDQRARTAAIVRDAGEEMGDYAYAALDGSASRTLSSVVDEYESVRAATLTLFEGLDADAWARRGSANGAPVTVASLPWIVLGHDLHHCAMLVERYGLGPDRAG